MASEWQAMDHGDEQVAALTDGWELRIVLNPTLTVMAELRKGDTVYTITQDSTAMYDLGTYGYAPTISVDNAGRPTVIWSREGGGSPFVWFCGIGVADWSTPV